MKNNAIEFYRFIFTIMVILLHFSFSIGRWVGGYIAVEFFFILSGFLMAASVEKELLLKRKSPSGGGISAAKYIMHRAKRLYPMFLFAFMLSFMTSILHHKFNFIQSLRLLYEAAWELLFLQITGLGNGGAVINIAFWYISALMVVSYFIYYLMQKYKEFFSYFLAPLSVILIYGFFSSNLGHIDAHFKKIAIGITYGLLRAWAGICLGCVCYSVIKYIRMVRPVKIAKLVVNLLELTIVITVFVVAFRSGYTQKDFIIIGMLATLVIIVFWNQTLMDKLLSNNISVYLGKISYAIYLTHIWIRGIFVRFDIFLDKPWARELVFIVVAVAFGALADWFVDQCLVLVKKLYKPEKFFKPVDKISLEQE